MRQARDLVFFVVLFAYLWLVVDMRLIYHGAGAITNFPAFYKGWGFFQQFTSYPGGPVEYLSAFLSQLFYYSCAGALVVSAQAWLFCVCTDYLFNALNQPWLRWIRFVSPIGLLVSYAQYTYFLPTTMALSAALVCVCLYLRASQLKISQGGHAAVFLAMSVILYYTAGGALLFFVVMCAVCELLYAGRWRMSLLYLLAGAAVPYFMGVLVFGVSIIDAFSDLLPVSWKILHYETRTRGVAIIYLLYLLVPVATLLVGLGRVFRNQLGVVSKTAKTERRKGPAKNLRGGLSQRAAGAVAWYNNSGRLRYVVGSVVLFGAVGSAAWLAHDGKQKIRFEVDYYACHRMWPEVVQAARRYPNNAFVVHAVNKALYHTGRLGYDMFSFPQHPGYLFLTDVGTKWIHWQIFDLYLDIGLINAAENALTECLEGFGEHPIVLQRLALINMVKGNIGSAKIYLGALSKTMFHADWAVEHLARLQSDPNLSTDREIQHLRSVRLERDYPTLSLPPEKALSLLLERNGQNRMAYEYLMAWYMLDKQLGKFVRDIERLKGLGYAELPRHYEEALIVYACGTGKPVYVSGYRPNPQMGQRIEAFSRLLISSRTENPGAFSELVNKYRDTYFFYYIYALSGTKK